MCTGEVVTVGRLLLDRAIETAQLGGCLAPMARLASGVVPTAAPVETSIVAAPPAFGAYNNNIQQQHVLSTVPISATVKGKGSVALEGTNGLCFLLCAAELNSAYDCEAVDVVLTPHPRVMSRLAGPKSGADKMADDEWMYQLKEKEDHGTYTRVNAVFAKIAANDFVGASALWAKCVEDASFVCYEVAKAGVARFLYQ